MVTWAWRRSRRQSQLAADAQPAPIRCLRRCWRGPTATAPMAPAACLDLVRSRRGMYAGHLCGGMRSGGPRARRRCAARRRGSRSGRSIGEIGRDDQATGSGILRRAAAFRLPTNASSAPPAVSSGAAPMISSRRRLRKCRPAIRPIPHAHLMLPGSSSSRYKRYAGASIPRPRLRPRRACIPTPDRPGRSSANTA